MKKIVINLVLISAIVFGNYGLSHAQLLPGNSAWGHSHKKPKPHKKCKAELRFHYDSEVCLGEPIHIRNKSKRVPWDATYLFDLGSDGTIDASAPAWALPRDTSFVIPVAGTFNFTVIVINSDTTCTDTLTGQVEVVVCPPDCDDLKLIFSYAREVCEGESIHIKNKSKGVDPNATYYLDLNSDGTNDLSASASDLPSDSTISLPLPVGTYNFTAIVVNPDGCSDTLSGHIEVVVCPPDCDDLELEFKVEKACVGEPVKIKNKSKGVDPNATYYLDLNSDGTNDHSANASDLPEDSMITLPLGAGTYDFTIIVVNPDGCSDTLSSSIHVGVCCDVELDFDFKHHVCAGDTIEIENESHGVDPNATYYFDLGSDGTIELSVAASDLPDDSTFVVPGVIGFHEFTIIVVNPDGCSDTIMRHLEIGPAGSCHNHHGHGHGHGHKQAGIGSKESASVSAYPNPVNDIAHIDLYTITESNVKVDMIGYDGRVIYTLYEGLVDGKKTLAIDQLEPGIYFIRMMTDNGVTAVERIVVTN